MARKDSFTEKMRQVLKREVQTVEEIRQATVEYRLLPADLAQQICQAADRERELTCEKIRGIDAQLQALGEERARARQLEHDALIVRPGRVITRQRLDGSFYELHTRPAYERGAAAMEAGRQVRAISQRIAALKEHRQLLMSDLGAIGRIRAAASRGKVTPLLAITANWHNRVDISALQPAVPLGRAFLADPFGNPLPPEALVAGGIDFGGRS